MPITYTTTVRCDHCVTRLVGRAGEPSAVVIAAALAGGWQISPATRGYPDIRCPTCAEADAEFAKRKGRSDA